MESLDKLKSKAVELLENERYKNILNEEHNIKKHIFEISNTEDDMLEDKMSFLEIAEMYLKEKTKISQKDMEFMCEISKQLKEQEIRKDDVVYTPIFKIVNKMGESRYFITRNTASEYIKNNENEFDEPQILEIVSNKNKELEKLLDIIKRNF